MKNSRPLPTGPGPILVSACLLGLATRYDGGSKPSKAVLEHLLARGLVPIPVCPEQLAGLPTPRPQTRFGKGDGEAVLDGFGEVLNSEGETVDRMFIRGAQESLKVARLTGCRHALLKERSPSCGIRQIHRGEQLVPGRGVTAALLQRSGLELFSEEDIAG